MFYANFYGTVDGIVMHQRCTYSYVNVFDKTDMTTNKLIMCDHVKNEVVIYIYIYSHRMKVVK